VEGLGGGGWWGVWGCGWCLGVGALLDRHGSGGGTALEGQSVALKIVIGSFELGVVGWQAGSRRARGDGVVVALSELPRGEAERAPCLVRSRSDRWASVGFVVGTMCVGWWGGWGASGGWVEAGEFWGF